MAKLELDEFEYSDLEMRLTNKELSKESINVFKMSIEYSYYFKYDFIDNKTETIQTFIEWLELASNKEKQGLLGTFTDYSGNFIAEIDEYKFINFIFIFLRDGDKIKLSYSLENIDEDNIENFVKELKNEYSSKFIKAKYKSKKSL